MKLPALLLAFVIALGAQILVVVPPTAHTAIPARTHWWKMETGSGTSAFDTGTGTASNCTLVGGAAWESNGGFQAIHFDGVNDRLDCGSTPGTNFSDITFSWWMNTDTTTVAGRVLCKDNGVSLFSWRATIVTANPHQRFAISNTSATTDAWDSPNDSHSTGTWEFWVVTIDDAGTNSMTQTIVYYKNGAAVTTTQTTSNTGTRRDDSTYTMRMAADLSTGTNFYDGLLDDVSIWEGTLLTSDQIAAVYAQGRH